MIPSGDKSDYAEWMDEWDKQQNAHIRNREERFEIMLDFVSETVGTNFVAIDLACGPGSISRRLLRRFPKARSVGVDYDPILLHIGKSTLGDVQGRLTWVEADLKAGGWLEKLPFKEFDAVLSTTALHWIPRDDLARLYGDIGKILRVGGVFINGDYMVPEFEPEKIRKTVERLEDDWENNALAAPAVMEWTQWWKELRKDKRLESLFLERDRRYPSPDDHYNEVSLDSHIKFLKDANFSEVGVIWQHLENRVLVGIK